MSNLELYLFSASTDDGESMDYFVWAKDKDEALSIWSKDERVADMVDDPKPDHVYRVRLTPPASAGMVDWYSPALEEVVY